MKSPRIYTYKVTFKGTPFWYWGVHKEMRYGEIYFGSPKTRKWVWDFYEPEIQILEFFPYTDEGWIEACKVEKRLIRPDLNDPYCLNENCAGYFSLEVLRKCGEKGAAAMNAEKDEDGKSVNAVKGAAAANAEKDEDGKSVNARKGAATLDAKLTKEEKSERGKKGAAATNAEKDEDGKSVNAKKGAAAAHAEKDKDGKSSHAVRMGKATHAVKDGEGKSVNAVKCGAATKLVRQKKVELTRVSDKVIFVFDAARDAARDLDLDQGALSKVCRGEQKTTKGYTARYL